MAEKFITELNAASGLALTDVLPIEQNVGAVPETKKMSIDHLLDYTFFRRYKLVAFVSGTTLNISIVDFDGNAPSATNPLPFRVGDARYDLVSSPAFTIAAGTNWLNMGGLELATRDTDLFLYAIGQSGTTLRFGFSRIPYALTMGSFTNGLTTPTDERAIIGNYTTYNATDAVETIGRFRVRLSAGAGYTWSMPSALVVNRPIYETDWLQYSGQVSPSGGVITTLGTISSFYRIVGRGLDWYATIGITTNGTGSGALRITLPFTLASQSQIFKGRENAVSGKMLQGFYATNLAAMFTYDNLYPAASGSSVLASGEAARLV